MTYLFLFTIGPVQSFIAQARKTQDLYAGSRLLSDLIHFATNQVGEQNIIYPAPNVPSKPNRFIAQMPISDKDAMRNYAEELTTDVKAEFMRIAQTYLGCFSNWEACQQQLRDFLEVHWAAVPYDGSNYGKDYKELEQQLGAAKNFRPFKQINEWGRKCSVTGTQNALFYRKNKGKKEAAYLCKECIILSFNDTYLHYWALEAGEGLSAIVLLKRLYGRVGNIFVDEFPSTADIAMLSTFSKLNERIDNKIKTLADAIGETPQTIGQFWFKENYNAAYFTQQGKDGKLADAKDAWEQIDTCIKLLKYSYHKYYAVLLFDADDMGKKIGEADEKMQNELSEKLGEFAEWARNYVENENRGKVIYAGGDDFLGMLTLPTLYETVQKLRQKFAEIVGMNFSAGIAIAHYKTPLSETLQWARKMEKQAKDVDKKDAFAIAAVRHSGQVTTTKLKWKIDFAKDYSDDNMTTTALQIIYEQLRDNFSSQWIRILENEGDIFEDAVNIGSTSYKMLVSELQRLINRACKLTDKDAKKVNSERLSKTITELLDTIWLVNDKNIQPVIDLLSIADFSNRKINE
ncbi:MAG: type III-B CRISPR-associated protein Cas10/Cmr2 [Chitinophagales bacterium]|nr:type III-B CRISPR-associated protein Cas10/Cmr2 [Chitinophagales bacterium]